MKTLRQEYEEMLDMQRFDPRELDWSVVERHVSNLSLLARVANCGITVFDMYRRRHVFVSCNFPEIFHYDLNGIEREDADYFSRHIHPADLPVLQRNGTACLRYVLEHPGLAPDVKLIEEYRVETGGRCVRVIEQFQILESDRMGNVWLSLSMLDLSPDQTAFDGVRSQLLNYRTGEVLPMPFPGVRPLLSERETEVLQLVGQGLLSKEIARKLSISVHTVNTHRQRILEKLDADNSLEAVRYAAARGLLD